MFVLLIAFPLSDEHRRGVELIANALQNAGHTVRSHTTLDEPWPEADWRLLVWSSYLAEALTTSPDVAGRLADTRHGILFLTPADEQPLPAPFTYSPNMVVDSEAAIQRLLDNLDARPAMAEPPPSPAPASRGEGSGGYVPKMTDMEPEMSGAEPPEEGVVYPVWYATNRKPEGAGFGVERNAETTTGRVDVLIPAAHRFGETGTPFWKRLLRFDLRDDRLRIQEIIRLDKDGFYGEIHGALEDAYQAGDTPTALLFLHGFNVTFEEAAIRAAQIGFDLKVTGPTAFFSWPSRGAVKAYSADEATIDVSEKAITDFLVEFVDRCQGARIHLIAHSMGNRGLLRALQRIAGNAETRGKVHFDQIFLAAPDVDRDLFLQLAHLYPEHAGRTTLYASDGDLPVYLSGLLHDAPRAGYFKPYTVVDGVDTIAVPDFDIDLLGHSYFAQAEALLYDMHTLIRHDTPPTGRPRLHDAVDGGKVFWTLGK